MRNVDNFYQTVNFHFRIEFGAPIEYTFPKDFTRGDEFKQELNKKKPLDLRFQSVTGLDATLDTETIKEGGENHFEHIIPLRRKYSPLVLKRGLLTKEESRITTWLKMAFDDHFIIPFSTVDIQLLNEEHEELMHWTANNVWPRSWKIGELNAERGEVLIETLELNYNYIILNEH